MLLLQLDPMNSRNFHRPGIHQSRIVSSLWEETKNLMTEHLGADEETSESALCSTVESMMLNDASKPGDVELQGVPI